MHRAVAHRPGSAMLRQDHRPQHDEPTRAPAGPNCAYRRLDPSFTCWLPFATASSSRSLCSSAANSRFFGNDLSAVPKMALTVGVGTIMDAREVVLIITGASKARALAECIENGVNHMVCDDTV